MEITSKTMQDFYEESKTLSKINQTFSHQQTNKNNKGTAYGTSLSEDKLFC
jgi:hypothetical protein